jgi:endonuclease YncB( thermonuclease family)
MRLGVYAADMLLTLATVISAGTSFTCTPIRVWDGDGPIWCAEGPKIRLAGIAAREIDGKCNPGHPCPKAAGITARNHLVRLLGGSKGTTSTGHVIVRAPALRCRSDGEGKGSRTAAWCVSSSVGDLSCAMVKSGYALKWDRYWGGRACPSGSRRPEA